MSDTYDVRILEHLIDVTMKFTSISMEERARIAKDCLEKMGSNEYTANDAVQCVVKMCLLNVTDMARFAALFGTFAGPGPGTGAAAPAAKGA